VNNSIKYRLLLVVVLTGLLVSLGSATALTAMSSSPGSSREQPNSALFAQQTPASNLYLPLTQSGAFPGTGTGTGEAWVMPGGNAERTSHIEQEIRGNVKPLWYKPFEPYIPQRVQIITAYDTLYISTSAGLYALDAATGAEKWVYATEMPLGHSPTVADGVAYVGGFDHRLHAVNAFTGQPLWTFKAGAGFDTNPLVAEGKVFAGNRDGYFYAVHATGSQAGTLAWKFKTQGPIHFSAAYKDGVVYFASDDSHAYALNAADGKLVWKSDKLPGAGFHSWWPVIYRDWVIFAGSKNYRSTIRPGPGLQYSVMEMREVYPFYQDPSRKGTFIGPTGNEPGDWVPGTMTLDTSRSNNGTVAITEYLEQKPWRRTYFVLNRATGKEYTTDFDQDGKPEYAPFLWFGTQGAGNRYPPVVGSDGVIYMTNNYMSDVAIADGHITGWKIGTPYISIVTGLNAVDEPIAYLASGDLIYWNRCCDRTAAAFDIKQPVSADERNREWNYYSYNLPELFPGYNEMTYVWPPQYSKPYGGVYGGPNGTYGWHGDVNPPVPYKGRIYMHGSNAILAFAPQPRQAPPPTKLPTAQIRDARRPADISLTEAQLKSLLAQEVKKMLDAKHLRPGYVSSGITDARVDRRCGDAPVDYWHTPGETIVTLLAARPHLSTELRARVDTYIKNEFNQYPPYEFNHIGWADGAPREAFDLPPEVEADRANFPKQESVHNFSGWNFNPYNFYAVWKYAEAAERPDTDFTVNVADLFSVVDSKLKESKLETPPPDAVLLEMPNVLNAYIAGYQGYLELAKLAKGTPSATVQSEYNRLLRLRAERFSKDVPAHYLEEKDQVYCRSMSISRNFIYLTPELANYLNQNALGKVKEAVDEYTFVAPYWFVSQFEAAFAEGVINPLYDYQAIFQAKAWILKEPQRELVKYVDVPGVAVGDLFYIQNLVAAIEAP
jgi:hypothetical protein